MRVVTNTTRLCFKSWWKSRCTLRYTCLGRRCRGVQMSKPPRLQDGLDTPVGLLDHQEQMMNLDPQTTAFVFPGQGSQTVGMGRELAEAYPSAKETFEEADSILGFSLASLMWNGPDTELN